MNNFDVTSWHSAQPPMFTITGAADALPGAYGLPLLVEHVPTLGAYAVRLGIPVPHITGNPDQPFRWIEIPTAKLGDRELYSALAQMFPDVKAGFKLLGSVPTPTDHHEYVYQWRRWAALYRAGEEAGWECPDRNRVSRWLKGELSSPKADVFGLEP